MTAQVLGKKLHHESGAAAREHLQILLTRFADDPPEYAGGLTNHLPMVLSVLAEAGVGTSRLDEYSARYRKRLPTTLAIGNSTESGLLYEKQRAHFRSLISARGIAAVARESLPQLLPSIEAAAFHGVIRLSHAVRSCHALEVANALAYWSVCAKPLPPPSPRGHRAFQSVGEWLRALHEHAMREPLQPRSGLITDRVAAVAAGASYRQLATSLALPQKTLPALIQDVALKAAQVYARSGNFTVLHVITGTDAVLQLARLLPEGELERHKEAVLASLAAAFLAAEPIESGSSILKAMSWDEIIALALDSDDDHVIKLVFSAWTWQQRCPGSVWLAAAQRAASSH